MKRPTQGITSPAQRPDELTPWIVRLEDGDRWWILVGIRKIAFVRTATIDGLKAVEDFGPRELVPVDVEPKVVDEEEG